MGFFRKRIIKGRAYTFYEERWRESGKVRCRSRIVHGSRSGASRKMADERYRDVLRENVYLFGKSTTAERLAREAAAREDYHLHLEAVSRGESGLPLSEQELHEQKTEEHWRSINQSSPFNARAGRYAVTHPSPQYRANVAHTELRGSVQAEDKALDAAQATAPPAPEAKNPYAVDDAYEARQEVMERTIESYTAMANAEDASAGRDIEGGSKE